MAGISGPAIAALWPTLRGESIVLDVGATIGGNAQHLVDLAAMGGAMARVLFDLSGPPSACSTSAWRRSRGSKRCGSRPIPREADRGDLDYVGFVEGDDIVREWNRDVVVTEGFSGNIALKTAEGTAKQLGEYLRSAMSRPCSPDCYLLARNAFAALKDKMDPRKVNGGCSSVSTASSSRVMAALTPKASLPRSISATTWPATSCRQRSRRRWGRSRRAWARAR
jgi:glycerol-3-phosphate acyltransferase PlsX